MGPFLSYNTVRIIFPDLLAWNIFNTGEFVFPLYGLSFFKARSYKPIFSPFVNIFWLKHVSLYTSHILLKISHGLHFSATKIFLTELFLKLKPFVWFGAISSKLKNISSRLEYIFLQNTSKKFKVCIHEKWHLKRLFCFLKKYVYLLNIYIDIYSILW